MRYTVCELPAGAGCLLLSGEFSPEKIPAPYNTLDTADISQYVWPDDGYRPEAHARVGWNEQGLHVLLYAKEETVRALCTKIGGRVCEDSCMEFFFMPFPADDDRYFNAEMNPIGTLHLGLGSGRHGRVKQMDVLPEGFVIHTSAHCGTWWAVSYTIPMTYIEEKFGKKLQKGNVMRGNFYACDETIHPHFGSWAPVRSEVPDFHRPESFEELILA